MFALNFKFLDRQAGGVLRNDFCHEKPWMIIARHSGKNPVFVASGAAGRNSTLDAAPSLKYTYKGLTTEGKIGSTGVSMLSVKYKPSSMSKYQTLPSALSNLTIGSRMERKMIKSVATDETSFSAEYQNHMINTEAIYDLQNKWSVTSCLTLNNLKESKTQMAFGGACNGAGKDLTTINYSLGGCISIQGDKPVTVTGKVFPYGKSYFGKWIGSIYTAAKPGTAMAAEIHHIIPEDKTEITLGGQVNLSEDDTTTLKAKLTPNANLATVLTHKFSPTLTGAIGCQFSTVSEDKGLRYGMKLTMST